MSTELLSAWETAAERTGGSAEATGKSFEGLTQQIVEFSLTGKGGPAIPYFKAMGIALTDSAGKARPLNDVFLDLADKFSKMDARQAVNFGRAIGLDDGTINMLMRGRAAVQGLLDESVRLGVATDKSGKASQDLLHSWANLQQAATDLGRTILNVLSPTIQQILSDMDEWIQKNKPDIAANITHAIIDLRDRAVELFNYLKTVDWTNILQQGKEFGVSLLDIVKHIDAIIQAMGGWTTAVEGLLVVWVASKFVPLLGVFSAIASTIGLVTGSITGVIGALTSPALLAAMAAYAGLHIASGAGQDELDKEEKLKEQNRKDHPENVLGPSDPKPDPFKQWWSQTMPRWLGGTPTIADDTMSPEQKAFLQTLSAPESGGKYNILNGGETVDDLSHHPGRVGKGGTSTAFGRYQFTQGTWSEQSAKLGLNDMSPVSQDRAAWDLAKTDYQRKTMRDLAADLKSGGHEAEITNALKGRWSSLPGGVESSQSQQSWKQSLNSRLNPVGDLSVGAQASASRVASNNTTNTSSSEVNVNGPITIHTKADDAKGIALSMKGALRDNFLVSQANAGLA